MIKAQIEIKPGSEFQEKVIRRSVEVTLKAIKTFYELQHKKTKINYKIYETNSQTKNT